MLNQSTSPIVNPSQPRALQDCIKGMVMRSTGSPRPLVYDSVNKRILSTTGVLESSSEDSYKPCIALNEYQGVYDGPSYRDTYITGRNVFILTIEAAGDPGPGWDVNGNGKTHTIDSDTGMTVRDLADMQPTVVFKQVDP